MVNKRGQFFLLAAVIISAVIISLGASTNKVTANDEPANFYDFGYEVQREVGAVLDYEVYSGFEDNADLEIFVDSLAEEVRGRSPGSEFIFIFGKNASDMKLKNYGYNSVLLDGLEVEGIDSDLVSRVCLKSSCQILDENIKDFGDVEAVEIPDNEREGVESVLVEIGGTKFEFPFSDYRQVIFIMQKNIGGDRHILVR